MRINYLFEKKIILFYFCLLFIGVFSNSYAQCPTISNNYQTFCNTQSPRVSNLVATNNGGGIVWYATANSTTPLANSAGLIDGETYYADDNTGNCGARPSVLVKIYLPPVGQPFQGVCVDNPNDATISNLIAVGNDVKWYGQPLGGTPLPVSTVLVDNTLYYASQTNPITGCETSRLSVFVNVGVVPVPIGSATQQFCDIPGNPPTVGDIIVNEKDVVWYATIFSSEPLPKTTLLVNGQSYYATTIDPPCESASRLRVDVTLIKPNDSGTSGEKKVCAADLATYPPFNLYNELGGTPDKTGVWSGPLTTTNGYLGTVNISTLTAAGSPYVFSYEVSPAVCPKAVSTVTIVVLPMPKVSITSNVSNICSGTNVTVTFTGTPNATVTYNVNGGANQTILLNSSGIATIIQSYNDTTIYNLVSIQSSGIPSCTVPLTTSYTITVLPLPTVVISSDATICPNTSATITFTGTPNATVTYNVNGGANQTIVLNSIGIATITNVFAITTIYNLVSIATSGGQKCSQPQTGSATITIKPLPVVTISGNANICPNSTATITFTGTADATVTYKVNNGSDLTILLNALGKATITGTYNATTTYTLVSVATAGTPSCMQPQTGTVVITILPLPTATISSNTTICSGASATVTFTGTPNATVTYNINGGTNQTILLNSAGTATIENTYSTTTKFNLISIDSSGSPSCSQPLTDSITIDVLPLPTVTISSNVSICSNDTATVTFTGTPNAIVTYTINGGSNQTITLDSLGKATIINTYSANTVFSLVSISTTGTPGCSQAVTGSITITVLPLPVVTISSNVDVCSGEEVTITFIGTPNSIVTYTKDGGANQTITLNSVGEATITNTYTTNTIYELVEVETIASPNCSQPQKGSVTITVLPLPTVTISSNTLICSGSDATVTFTGTPNAIVTYKVNNGSDQTINLDSNGIATIINTYATTTIYSLVKITLTNPSGCSQPQTGSMIITVTQPPIAGNNASLTLCSNSNSQDLFLLLGPSAQKGGTWNPAMASGTGFFNPLLDPQGTYVYTVVGTPPCKDASAAVNVSVILAPNAGTNGSASFCSNENPVDLFSYIGGTPQIGGTWTPTLASGTNIFNPAIDTAGNYTYTILGVFPCSNATSVVNVTVTPGPNAGDSGTAVFCINSTPHDLFDSLGGTPQIGGTWSPAMASGTGVFNPLVDAPGDYTYSFAGTQPCDSDSATVTVNINPIPDAGTNGTAFFCTNYKPSDLFLNLGGTPQTDGTWSPALASGTGIFNPLVDIPGVYTYTIGGNYCTTATASVTVSVTQSPNAGGANAPLLINTCGTNTSVDLNAGLNGTQSPGVWSDDDKTGALTNNVFNPSIPGPGTYHFTYSVGGGVSPCLFDTATVTVVVSPSPNSGTFTGIQNVCTSVATFDLFTLLSNYQTGGIWTDNNAQTVNNPIAISNFTSNTYSYTYTITNSCGNAATIVQLSVIQNPIITGAILNASTTCINYANQVFITGANSLTNGDYIINYQLSGAITSNLIALVTFTNGSGSFIIPASSINNAGEVTVTISEILPTSNLCGTNGSTINPISFTVIKVDAPQIISNGNEFCGADDPTISDLSANIVGNVPVLWYNAPTVGTVYAPSDLLQNGTTYYATYTPNSGCESVTRLSVTVDLTVCDDLLIPDGFSPNGDGINDDFVIKNIDYLFPNFELEVYNRYGNIIYKGNKNTPNWNGTTTVGGAKLGNGVLPTGVYFYVLNYNDGITKPKQGRVYLSR